MSDIHNQLVKIIQDVWDRSVQIDEATFDIEELFVAMSVESQPAAQPVAWMLECQTLSGDTGWILSWSQSGAGLCNRIPGLAHEKPLYAAPHAAAPVPDERAAFQASSRINHLLRDHINPFHSRGGEYSLDITANLWEGWQARAALKEQPK